MSQNLTQNGDTEPTILDNNPTNWLVQFPGGDTDLVTKTDLKVLLFEHDLWGLLKENSTVWRHDGRYNVEIVPHGGNKYELFVNDKESIHIGPHRKSEMVAALRSHYESDNQDAVALVKFHRNLHAKQVRRHVVEHFGKLPPLDGNYTDNGGGWLINKHLLLTWSGDFHHPGTTSRTRSGSVVDKAANEKAYDINLNQPTDGIPRQIEIDGEEVRVTDDEMKFVAKALWAVTQSPGEI